MTNDNSVLPDSSATASHRAKNTPPKLNPNGIAQMHWFGAFPEDNLSTQPIVATFPGFSTIELRGISVTGNKDTSGAFVAEKGKPEVFYHLGDELSGIGTLEEVDADHITIRTAGQLKNLGFPEYPQNTDTTPQSPDSPHPPNLSADTVPGRHHAIVQTPAAHDSSAPSPTPEEMLATLGLTPVNPDISAGYRVTDVTSSGLAANGLEEDDVILTINNRPVGNGERDKVILKQLLDGKDLKLGIQRGEKRFTIVSH